MFYKYIRFLTHRSTLLSPEKRSVQSSNVEGNPVHLNVNRKKNVKCKGKIINSLNFKPDSNTVSTDSNSSGRAASVV
jgi:hypothetical protein